MCCQDKRHGGDHFVKTDWDDRRWRKNFRVNRANFFRLVDLLRPRLEIKGCNVKKPLAMELMVAALLKRLASGDEFKGISELLGIGETTCCRVAFEAACAVMSALGHLVSREHYVERLPSIQAAFYAHRNFGWRGVCGAVDGTYIAIKRPKGTRGKAYYSRNRKYTIVMQAVAAPDLSFVEINFGHAGAVHDSVVFRTLQLGKISLLAHILYASKLLMWLKVACPFILFFWGIRDIGCIGISLPPTLRLQSENTRFAANPTIG